MDILIFLLLLSVLAFLAWDRFFNEKSQGSIEEKIKKYEDENLSLKEQGQNLKLENEKRIEKIGELQNELEKERSERNEMAGKNKQMFVTVTALQEKNQNLQSSADELNKKVVQHESGREKKEKDFERKVEELEQSRKSLDDEKQRVRREDEERLEKLEEERNRIWNEHENVSIAKMKEVCIKPELTFSYFENTSLPETFDGSLKPDFLVEFLGQYIIFDAKMSRSANLQNYIADQVKSTAKKIKASKNTEEIYKTVFFIIPTLEITSLKKTFFYEDGYSFYVIPVESFEAILGSYKKVKDYDLAESFDPKERENIVNLIASYDQHIHRQNALNILSSLEGLKVSTAKESLGEDMKGDIEVKKQKIRLENFKPTELKRLINNPEEQIQEMKNLV
ncbi:hypothetical protein HON22_00920, partial [Candidatus Peregrinibacteria bacterium]|nr:hypothetical protein [Candidatus Peregrinibacteria bacterium]